MMINKTVYLFNISKEQSETTGLIEKTVSNKRKMLGKVSQVGANTYWNATSAEVELSYQVEIQSNMYRLQKYIAFRNFNNVEIYEIYNTGKASQPHLITLNVRKTSENIEGVIENVL